MAALAVDAAQQHIRADRHILKRNAGQMVRGHAELKRLRAAELMQGFDVRTHRVLHGAGVLADKLGGGLLGADDGADGQVRNDLLEVHTVDLGEQTSLRVASGVQGEQDVLLVHAGEGRKRAAGGQALLIEQLAVGAVAVNDRCGRQLLGQKFAPLQTVFDDFHRETGVKQDFREEKGDFAAADQHGVLDGHAGDADLVEEELLLLRGDNDRDVVACVQNEVALGDIGRVAAADHAQQHIGAQKGIDLAYRQTLQTGLRRNADVEQLDAAACERADADGGRETHESGNDTRGRKLGLIAMEIPSSSRIKPRSATYCGRAHARWAWQPDALRAMRQASRLISSCVVTAMTRSVSCTPASSRT